MEQYLKDKPDEGFKAPENVELVSICAHNGLPLKNQESTASGAVEYFVKGTVPTAFCSPLAAKPTPSVASTPTAEPLKEENKESESKEISIPEGESVEVSI